MKKQTLNLITLGCSKNLVDSEKILGKLSREKFSLLHNSNKATDVVIINTCGFISDAKEESIDTIIQFTEAKKHNSIKKIIVIGCLSQRYKNELLKEIPEIDAIFGVDDNAKLFSYLNNQYSSKDSSRLITTPSHYAYLKISEGCDRYCSFCAIPYIRGKYKSLSIECLYNEAKNLAEKGVKELLLIAQDINSYGLDIYSAQMLDKLLEELIKIENIEWIKLHYAYPHDFPEKVIALMRDNSKLCNYIDIPVQHISNKILKSMQRGHNKDDIINFIEKARNLVPGIALRTTVMVGYPGENDNDYNELLNFIKQARFERLGVFPYSAEEGTKAFKLKDNIPEKIKKERAKELMEVQQGISLAANKSKIGKELKVIVDHEEADFFVGRTEYDSPEVDNEVLINKASSIKIGGFYNVIINDASDYELFGSVV